MSKQNPFAPTPSGSRPSSPPPTGYAMTEEDKDREALLMGPLGGDRSKVNSLGVKDAPQPTAREQGEHKSSCCCKVIR